MSYTVLLVDDEPHILRAAEFKLQKAGFRVLCAEDGEEAWQAIQQKPPDLVVTDLQMPRLTGTELIQRIRAGADTAGLPVILLTAKGFELAPAETAEAWGVREVISKPFSPRELCNRVQAVLDGGKPAAPPSVAAGEEAR